MHNETIQFDTEFDQARRLKMTELHKRACGFQDLDVS